MKQFLISAVLILVSLPLIYPYLQPGAFATQDGEWAIVRQVEMVRELKDLQFPPRWSGYLNHGFGYPLFLFTYPFPFYMGSILRLMGMSYVLIIKSLFIFSIIGSAFSMYYFGSTLWGRWGGLLTTVLYLYSPYRAINLYIRGSLGESLMFVIFPVLYLGIYKFIVKRSWVWFFITTIGISILLTLHNALALLFLPFLLVWTVYLYIQNSSSRILTFITLVYVLGLMLSAYFWMPAVLEKKFIKLDVVPLANQEEHLLNLKKLIFTPWTKVESRPPIQIGIPHFVIFLISVIFIVKLNRGKRRIAAFYMAAVIFSIIAMMPVALPLWKAPVFNEIDFPWRYLAVTCFLMAILSGSVAQLKYGKWCSIILSMIVMLFGYSYLRTSPVVVKSDAYYETNDATTTSNDELMPIWVKNKPTNRPDNSAYFAKPLNSEIAVVKQTSTQMKYSINSVSENVLYLNTLYFPGWKVFIDQKPTEINVVPNTGLISIIVSSGTHGVDLIFEKTPVRAMADIISLSALGGLVIVWILSRKISLL